MDKFVFWQQPLRVMGPATAAQAEEKLRAMVYPKMFSMQDRLAGKMKAEHIRVWKASNVAFAGDVVEFEGALRPDNAGSIIEGRLRYKTRSKIQFIGLLAMGVGYSVIGLFQKLSATQPEGNLLAVGGAVTFITLFWIYASVQMRHTQIEFIEAKLNEAVAA